MITPAMIEAGAAALRECKEGLDEGEKALIVYEAMVAAIPPEEEPPVEEPEPAPTYPAEKIPDAQHILKTPDKYPAEVVAWAKAVLAAHGVAEPVPTPPDDPVDETPVPAEPVKRITSQTDFTKALAAVQPGQTIYLGKGNFALPSNKFNALVTIDGQSDTIFAAGQMKGATNIRLLRGQIAGTGGDLVVLDDSDGLIFEAMELYGPSNTGKGLFGRRVKNLRLLDSTVRNIRDGVVIWTGEEITIDGTAFRKMGSDCFDPSDVYGAYFRHNDIRDAMLMAKAHPDLVQLGTTRCRKVRIIGNISHVDSMGYDDFGCIQPNEDVIIDNNDITTLAYENSIVIEKVGTTGEVTNNRITQGRADKKPIFKVPSSMSKSGNTLNGKLM